MCYFSQIFLKQKDIITLMYVKTNVILCDDGDYQSLNHY